MHVVVAVGFGMMGSHGSSGVGIVSPLIVQIAIWGILNNIRSNDVARLLPFESKALRSSVSNSEVLVMYRVWVIAVVHPVDIVVSEIFSRRGLRSISKINLVNPLGAIKFVFVPKYNSVTGF